LVLLDDWSGRQDAQRYQPGAMFGCVSKLKGGGQNSSN
jgi:hypothetical protein